MEPKTQIATKQLESTTLDGFQDFPGRFYVLKLDDGTYACNNATLPDLQCVDGLACFPEPDDAVKYMELPHPKSIKGRITSTTFEEAREIAKGRPGPLNALLLFVRGKVKTYHFIR